jgi:hypothetical protein
MEFFKNFLKKNGHKIIGDLVQLKINGVEKLIRINTIDKIEQINKSEIAIYYDGNKILEPLRKIIN